MNIQRSVYSDNHATVISPRSSSSAILLGWKGSSFLVFITVIMVAVISFCGDSCAKGLKKQGRWFTYNGQYVYLVGVDAQQLAADPSLDYAAILKQLQSYRINKVRIWLDAYWNPDGYLHPWTFDTVTRQYNLDAWNQTYWDRVKAFVSEAQEWEIMVEVSIFSAYPSDPSWWSGNFRVAWNKDFNVNGAFSTNRNGHFFPEFFDLNHNDKSSSGKTLKDYQQALVDKALLELGKYPNVYFEVMNEFFEFASDFPNGFKAVAPWQQYWADYLRANTDRLVSVHVHDATNAKERLTHGVQYFWDRPSVDVLNFHLYKPDPKVISNHLHASQNMGKILQNNESHEWYSNDAVNQKKLDKVTREAWGWLLSGGYYAFYNGQHTEYSGWNQLGARAKVISDIADKIRFWEMSPIDESGKEYDLLLLKGPAGKNRQLLANPSFEYLAYFWGKPEKTFWGKPKKTDVIIQLPDGNYSYEWYDPRSGELLASGTITAKKATTITSPSPFAWSSSVGLVLIVAVR